MCFKVTNRTDSRVVLDEMGAEKLLGMGDMLFLAPGTSQLLRGQGTYLSDDEINSDRRFREHRRAGLRERAGHAQAEGRKRRSDLDRAARRAAIRCMKAPWRSWLREGRGSVSLLQRALGIGYGRAARLIDFMAEDGIVGHYAGSQAREILISMEDWERMKAGDTGESAPASPASGGRKSPGVTSSPSKPRTAPEVFSAPAATKRKNKVVPEPWEEEPSEEEEVVAEEFDESNESESLWEQEEKKSELDETGADAEEIDFEEIDQRRETA